MMTDYAALKVEIAKAEYNGMTDAQIAAAINQKTIQIKQDIPTDLAKMALIRTAAYDWGELVGVAQGSITAGQLKRKRCVTFYELLNTQTPLEVKDDDAWWAFIVQLLAEMVTDTVITTQGKNAFEALRQYTFPFGESIGWPGPVPGQVPSGVGDGDVTAARAWNG